MQGAVFALMVNIAVALLFAMSFAIIARTNPSHRSVYGFSVSYAIGALTPLSELVLPFSGWPEPFMVASYMCFMLGLLAMSAALLHFYGRAVPWRAMTVIVLGTLVLRWLFWGGTRNTMPYEMLYQLPFFVAAAMSAWVLLRHGSRRPLEIAAGATFGVVALHFLAKPFLALAFGSGRTASDYVASTYSLISQASTGILLTAAGLMILLITLQSIVGESRAASETDPLSGLANRRGFDLRAGHALERARDSRLPLSVVMFDIDHFKAINDAHGHATGDAVIRSFADLLRRAAPHACAIGRMGGEEFALLFEHTNEEGARLHAEAIRVAAAEPGETGLPRFTVSGGVASIQQGEPLSQALRRADMALYSAKRLGRDRVCIAEPGDAPQDPLRIAS